MNAETAQRLSVLSAIYGQKNSILHVKDDGLHISGGDASRHIELSGIVERVRISSNVLWANIIVETSSGTLIFRGFGRSALLPVAVALNVNIRLYAEDCLSAECIELHSVAEAIDKFLSKQQYARQSKRLYLIKAAEKALAVQDQKYWEHYANEAQRTSAEVALNFIQYSEKLSNSANEVFVENEMKAFEVFFDTVEKNPLTPAQRLSCVTNEDNNLVLAGAGTGKTSTMIGRAGYLIASGQAIPDEILMLAYARKAAGEMQERQNVRLRPLISAGTPTIKTFHAIGLEIIRNVEGKKPAISSMVEDDREFLRFVNNQLLEKIKDDLYLNKIIQFFVNYMFPYRNPFDFDSMKKYYEYVRTHELRTLQGEVVKSYEECEIANFLLQHNISYKYEAPYCIDTAGPDYRQYKPDFFLPDLNIYLEHFALNKNGEPPDHFDQQGYLDGIKWKRELHIKHKTKLLETYSYQKRDGSLLSELAKALEDAGAKLVRRRDEELLEDLKSKGVITEFAKLLSKFLDLYKQTFQSWEQLSVRAMEHIDAERMSFMLAIFKPIYESYQAYLKERQEIDFADMIGRAIEYIESGRFNSPYTHIMIDEMQDISPMRAKLILALRRQCPDSVVFAVGDDWQSIYRFAGSDINYIKRFEQKFGKAAITSLDTTFRFNDKLGKAASTFVLKNPDQIKKVIESNTHIKEPAISMVRILETDKGLKLALEAINIRLEAKNDVQASVLVLARYRFMFEDIRRNYLTNEFPNLDINYMTVHAAKGKEADYVLVLGLVRGGSGFPSEKTTDMLLEFVLPTKEKFHLAEERRLFYVAITRAKERVYLIYNPLLVSSFVAELLTGDYEVCSDEFDEELVHPALPAVICPKCTDGSLVPRKGRSGIFIGCACYPYCKYTERSCPECDYLMEREGRFKICTNKKCDAAVPVCPNCGACMVKREGPHGSFWGCLNYRTNAGFICTHTENNINLPCDAKQSN